MNSSLSLFNNLNRGALRRTLFIVLSLTLLIISVASAHDEVWRDVLTLGNHKAIAQLDNGDFIVGGDYINGSERDIYISRVKADKTVVWHQSFNSLNDDTLNHLIADPATGEIYFCGTRTQIVSGQQSSDWFVMKFNSNGTAGWSNAHTYGYAGTNISDSARCLSFVQDGGVKNIVVVGSANNNAGRVVKLNAATGAQMWEYLATTIVTDPNFSNVATDIDGNIYVIGVQGFSSDGEAVIMKFNASNNTLLWKKAYKPNVGGFNNWFNIAIDPVSKDIIVAGLLVSSVGANSDIGFARYDAAGNRLWAKQVDGGFTDRVNSVVIDGDTLYLGGIYRFGASDPEWFIGSFSLENGNENWRFTDGGDFGTGDSLGNLKIVGSKIYAAGVFGLNATQNYLTLVELNKANGDVLERTKFVDQVSSFLPANHSLIVTNDGDFIVVNTKNSVNTEIGRYRPSGGSEPPATAPVITTPTSASVAMNTATLGGNVTGDGGAAITERGVVYALTSANSNPEIGGTSVTKVAATAPHGAGVFTVAVSSLTAKSGYTYKAYAQNSVGTTYTTASTFTTTGPTISVLGNGTVIANGDSSPSSSDHTVFTSVNIVGATSSRTFNISNIGTAALTLGNPAVTVTGSDFTVTTAPGTSVAPSGNTNFTITFDPSTTGVKNSTVSIANNDTTYTFSIQGTGNAIPTVTTSAATLVKGYSATVNGTVNPNGLATTYSFEYSADPDLNTGVVSTTAQNLTASFSGSSVTANISELQPETTYYYRLVATNSLGESQGLVSSFTTAYPLSTNEPLTALNGLPGGGLIYRPIPGVINNAGRILFQSIGLVGSGTPAITGASDEWLMNDASGIPRVILREGDQLGSESGNKASALFNHLLLGESGQSFTSEKIAGATTEKDYGYLAISQSGDSVAMISQEGDTAPDGGVFINSVGKPALDSQERFYFQGSLSGVVATLASGVWYDAGEGLSTLVQAGQDLTGITGDPAWLGKVSNILAAGGNGVSFVAALQPNPTDTKAKTDVLRSQAIISANVGAEGTELSIIARKGDAVSGGSTINNITAVSRSVNEGHAFVALMKTGTAGVAAANDEVLVAVIEGESTLIAREATTNLDGGLTPKSFGDFYVTADGNVVFQSVLNGAPATSDGILCIWLAETGTVVKLAREGDLAPDTGGLTYGTIHTLGVSDNGNIVLQTILSNGKHGLHRNVGAGFEFLVKAGATDTVDFGGTPRAILSIGLYTKTTGTGGGGGGMGSAINDAGDVFAVLSIGAGDYVARVFRGEVTPAPSRPAIP